MIEFFLTDYLESALNIPVFMEKPERQAMPYIVLEKTGSAEVNFIPEATIAVQSYDDTLAKAAKLNQRVKAAMLDAIELDGIDSVKLNSDYNFTDTTTKQYRYQGVYVVTYAREVENNG